MIQQLSRRTLRALAATAMIAAVLVGGPAAPAEETPPIAQGDHEQSGDIIPSFSESPGCGELDGVRGPTATNPGQIPLEEPIYGPWGDFFGRTEQAAWDQRVVVQLPAMNPGNKALFVHERVLPAFEQVVANLEAEAAQGNVYEIRDDHTFSWAAYTVPPRRHFSFHAVGMAIDVNSTTNPYRGDNVLITDMPQWFVDAWVDAGWCWGGDWQTIKDPMHFSWKGPRFTPGYELPAPQAPLVGAADFTSEYDLGVRLLTDVVGPEVVVDIDRDGAVDVVRIEQFPGGQHALRAAPARHSHETCRVVAPTDSVPVYGAGTPYLEDLSADGRPDLIYIDDSGATLQLEVFTLRQHEAMARSLRSTGVAPAPSDIYRFDDHDRDGRTDLYVIRDGDPAGLEVWAGPDFTTKIVDTTLGVPAAGNRFDLGDRDVDGLPDLYAFAADGTLVVHLATDGFTAGTPVATGAAGTEDLFLADLDGDGHSDVLLVEENGQTRMLRGGASTHDPGTWFEVHEDGWRPGADCAMHLPVCLGMPATVIGSTGDDVLYGTDGDNVFWARAGDDTILSGHGHDRICANTGDDRIEGGNGRDEVQGGPGNDVVFARNGLDRILGGPGNDVMYGHGHNDWISGGPGNDLAVGNHGGHDRCFAERTRFCELP